MSPPLEQHLEQNADETDRHAKFSGETTPRKAPSSGPQLSVTPDKLLVFEEADVIGGFEVLTCTINIVNQSLKTINFKFSRDAEFKFEPCDGRIASQCSVTIIASFYNVDGNCSPRKSSVELCAIRIRSDDPEDIQKLWLCTPAKLITRKRWKFQFNRPGKPNPCHSPSPEAYSPRDTDSGLGDDLKDTDKVSASCSPSLEKPDSPDEGRHCDNNSDQTQHTAVQGRRFSVLYRDQFLLGRKLFWLGFVSTILTAWRLATHAPQATSEDCWKIWDTVYCL